MAKTPTELPFIRGEPYAFLTQSRRIVFDYIRATSLLETPANFSEEDVIAYWFTKDDDDWRVALSTTLSDELYYRVSHSSHTKQTTLEPFHRVNTIVIPDKDKV